MERLEIDYLKLTSECIPYEKLGFKSLAELLMSNSSVCKASSNCTIVIESVFLLVNIVFQVISHNGNYLISAVPTPETQHMQVSSDWSIRLNTDCQSSVFNTVL